jgi:segregation and condensation protein B
MTPPAFDDQPPRRDRIEPSGPEPSADEISAGPAWLVDATGTADSVWVVEDAGTAEDSSVTGGHRSPARASGEGATPDRAGDTAPSAARDAWPSAAGEAAPSAARDAWPFAAGEAGADDTPEIVDLADVDDSLIGGDAARVAREDGDAEGGVPGASEADEDRSAAAMPPLADGSGVWPSDEALEAVGLDDQAWTRRNLEAILLVADEPVAATELAELVGARLTEVEGMLVDLAGEYAGQGRGFVLRAVAGGWRLYTHPGAKEVVDAYLRAGQQSRLTRAALETLAVIAYRQPVTRHQVAAVRGVNVDGVFRTLVTRGLIQEVGHEEGPGQAALYATTPAFLEQLGLHALDQLPPVKDYLPEGVDLMDLQEQM